MQLKIFIEKIRHNSINCIHKWSIVDSMGAIAILFSLQITIICSASQKFGKEGKSNCNYSISDSCHRDNGLITEYRENITIYQKKNCFCDSICTIYGDCCTDSSYFFKEHVPRKLGESGGTFECASFDYVVLKEEHKSPLFMNVFTRCPIDPAIRSTSSNETIDRCEGDISMNILQVQHQIYFY